MAAWFDDESTDPASSPVIPINPALPLAESDSPFTKKYQQAITRGLPAFNNAQPSISGLSYGPDVTTETLFNYNNSLPKPEQPKQETAGLWQTTKDVVGGIGEAFRGTPAVIASAIEGVENPDKTINYADEVINENRARQQKETADLKASGEYDRPMSILPYTRGEWLETTQSFPFTLAGLAPSLVGNVIGGAAGGAAAGMVTSNPIGIAAGGIIGGLGGATLGSYHQMGASSANQFIRDAVDKYKFDFKQKENRDPTTEEVDQYYKNEVEPQASRVYHGEAAPEALGTAVETSIAKSAIGDIIKSSGSLPVRLLKAGAKIALSAFGIEPTTETITQQIQQPAYAALGMSNGEGPRSMTSFDDWVKSAGEVYKQAATTSLFFTLLGVPIGAAYKSFVRNPSDAKALVNVAGNPEIRAALPDETLANLAVMGERLNSAWVRKNPEIGAVLNSINEEIAARTNESLEDKQKREKFLAESFAAIPENSKAKSILKELRDNEKTPLPKWMTWLTDESPGLQGEFTSNNDPTGNIDVQRLNQNSGWINLYGFGLADHLRKTLDNVDPAAATPAKQFGEGFGGTSEDGRVGTGEGRVGKGAGLSSEQVDSIVQRDDPTFVGNHAKEVSDQTVLKPGDTVLYGGNTHNNMFEVVGRDQQTGLLILRNPNDDSTFSIPPDVAPVKDDATKDAPVNRKLFRVDVASWKKAVDADRAASANGLIGWGEIEDLDPVAFDQFRRSVSKGLEANPTLLDAQTDRWTNAFGKRIESLSNELEAVAAAAQTTGMGVAELSQVANQRRFVDANQQPRETPIPLADALAEVIAERPTVAPTQQAPVAPTSPSYSTEPTRSGEWPVRSPGVAGAAQSQSPIWPASQSETNPYETQPALPQAPSIPGVDPNIFNRPFGEVVPATTGSALPALTKVTLNNPLLPGSQPIEVATDGGYGAQGALAMLRQKADEIQRAAAARELRRVAESAQQTPKPILALPAPQPVMHPLAMTPSELQEAVNGGLQLNPWEHSYRQWQRLERAMGTPEPQRMTPEQHQKAVQDAVVAGSAVPDTVRAAATPKPVKQPKAQVDSGAGASGNNKQDKNAGVVVVADNNKNNAVKIIPTGTGSSVSPRSMTPPEAELNPGNEDTKGKVVQADDAASKGSPTFQGNKRQHIKKLLPLIRFLLRKVTPSVRAVYDYFGGGGGWGLALATRVAVNAQELHLFELNENRALKIRLFMGVDENGDQIEGGMSGDKFQQIADNVKSSVVAVQDLLSQMAIDAEKANADKIDSSGNLKQELLDDKGNVKRGSTGWELLSSGTLAKRIEKIIDSIPAQENDVRAVLQAIIDQGTSSLSTPKFSQADKNKNTKQQFESRIDELYDNAVANIVNYIDGIQANLANIRSTRPNFKVFVKQANSFEEAPREGADVLAVYDPPYYGTAGYDGSSLVPIGLYEHVYQGLQRLRDAGNHIIYTDELWWGKERLPGDMGGGPGTSADRSSAYQIYDSIRSIIPLQWVEIGSRDKPRNEILGVYANEAGAAAIQSQPGAAERNDSSAPTGQGTGNTNPTGTGSTPESAGGGVGGKPPAKNRQPITGSAAVAKKANEENRKKINPETFSLPKAVAYAGGWDIQDALSHGVDVKGYTTEHNNNFLGIRLFRPENGLTAEELSEVLGPFGYDVLGENTGDTKSDPDSFVTAFMDATTKRHYTPDYYLKQAEKDREERYKTKVDNHNRSDYQAVTATGTTKEGKEIHAVWEVRPVKDKVDVFTVFSSRQGAHSTFSENGEWIPNQKMMSNQIQGDLEELADFILNQADQFFDGSIDIKAANVINERTDELFDPEILDTIKKKKADRNQQPTDNNLNTDEEMVWDNELQEWVRKSDIVDVTDEEDAGDDIVFGDQPTGDPNPDWLNDGETPAPPAPPAPPTDNNEVDDQFDSAWESSRPRRKNRNNGTESSRPNNRQTSATDQAPPAETQPRSGSIATESIEAIANTGAGLANLADGFLTMFGAGKGGTTNAFTGIPFDPARYEQAKPLFIEAFKHFGKAAKNVAEIVKIIIDFIVDHATKKGMNDDQIDAFIDDIEPYARQFTKDVMSGKVVIKAADPVAPITAPAEDAVQKVSIDTILDQRGVITSIDQNWSWRGEPKPTVVIEFPFNNEEVALLSGSTDGRRHFDKDSGFYPYSRTGARNQVFAAGPFKGKFKYFVDHVFKDYLNEDASNKVVTEIAKRMANDVQYRQQAIREGLAYALAKQANTPIERGTVFNKGNAAGTVSGSSDPVLERLREQIRGLVRSANYRSQRVAAQSRTPAYYRGQVDRSTVNLIERGLNAGIPQSVIDWQIEDIGRALANLNEGKPAFMLSSDPGSGKTFTIGGFIKDALANDSKARVLYFTNSNTLIDQIRNQDLKDYGINDGRVDLITYARIQNSNNARITHSGGTSTIEFDQGKTRITVDKNTILVFDESHKVKNILDEGTGSVNASELMRRAKFSFYSSATPFETPSEANYLANSGLFNEYNELSRQQGFNYKDHRLTGFQVWAVEHGAILRQVEDKAGNKKLVIAWGQAPRFTQDQTTSSAEQQAAIREFENTHFEFMLSQMEQGQQARQWFIDRNLLTHRPITLGTLSNGKAASVTHLTPVESEQSFYEDIYNPVVAVFDAALADPSEEAAYLKSTIMMQRENVKKRMAELAKLKATAELVKRDLKDPSHKAVVFVKVKSPMTFGRSEVWSDKTDDTGERRILEKITRAIEGSRRDILQAVADGKFNGNTTRAIGALNQLKKQLIGKRFDANEMDALNQEWGRYLGAKKTDPETGETKNLGMFSAYSAYMARAFMDADMADLKLDSPIDTLRTLLEPTFGKGSVVEYSGSLDEQKNVANREAWKQSGTGPRIMIATMDKGGTGLSLHDLQGTRPSFQYNVAIPYTATEFEQVSGRIARYGLQSQANVHWLFANNMPDQFDFRWAKILQERLNNQQAVVKGNVTETTRNLTAQNVLGQAQASRSTKKASGVTRGGFVASIKKAFPHLSGAIDKVLARGERGDKGGTVLIDSNDPDEIARVYAEKTGRSFEDTQKEIQASKSDIDGETGGLVPQFSKEEDVLQGFYDPRSGLTFAILPNLSPESAPAVFLHETGHGQQRADITRRAVDLINRRSTIKGPMRAFLDQVFARMAAAGAVNKDGVITLENEAAPYIIEQAVLEGRKNGFNYVDGKFMDWVDAKLGKPVGDLIRKVVNFIRGTMLKYGFPININKLTVDDLVNFAMIGVERAAEGKVRTVKDSVITRERKQYDRSDRRQLVDQAIRIFTENPLTDLVQRLHTIGEAEQVMPSRKGAPISEGTSRDTGRSVDLVASGDYIPIVGRTVGAVQVGAFKTGINRVTTPEQAAAVLLPISRQPQEHVVALVADRKGKPLAIIQHTVGLSGESLVDDKILIGSAANIKNADQIWFAHNHPSTDAEQSQADYRVSASLNNLMKDSGLTNKGMIVLAANQTVTWVDPVTMDERVLPNATQIGNKPVPVMSRQFTLFEEGQTISKKDEQTEFLKQFTESGVLLLDGDSSPLAWVPMDISEMMKLRSGSVLSGSTRLMRVLEQTNADWALVKVDDISKNEAAISNMMGFFNTIRVDNLDAQDKNGNTLSADNDRRVFRSMASSVIQGRPMFSKAWKPTPGILEETQDAPKGKLSPYEINEDQSGEVYGIGHHLFSKKKPGASYIDQYGGELYETSINAKANQYLNWDKPANQQSPYVRKALKSMGISLAVAEQPGNAVDWLTYQPGTGGALYAALVNQYGGDKQAGQKVSRMLADAGIIGTKAVGESEKYNHIVVFDDNLLTITKRERDSIGKYKAAKMTKMIRDAIYAEDFEYLPKENVTIIRKNGTYDIIRGRVARVKVGDQIYFMTPNHQGIDHILIPEHHMEKKAKENKDIRSFFSINGDKSSVVYEINSYVNNTLKALGINDPVNHFDEFREPFGGAMLYVMNLDVMRNAIESGKPVIISVSEKHEPILFDVYSRIKNGDKPFIDELQGWLDNPNFDEKSEEFKNADPSIQYILVGDKNRDGLKKSKSRWTKAQNGGLQELARLLQYKNVVLNGNAMVESYSEAAASMKDGKKVFMPDDSNYGDLAYESPGFHYEKVEDDPQNPEYLLSTKRELYAAAIESGSVIVATNNQTPILLNGLIENFGDSIRFAGFTHFSQFSEDKGIGINTPKGYDFIANFRPEFIAIINKDIGHENKPSPNHITGIAGTDQGKPGAGRQIHGAGEKIQPAGEGNRNPGRTGLPDGTVDLGTAQSPGVDNRMEDSQNPGTRPENGRSDGVLSGVTVYQENGRWVADAPNGDRLYTGTAKSDRAWVTQRGEQELKRWQEAHAYDQQPTVTGYRGDLPEGGHGFGSSEGNGVYIAKTHEAAQFFSLDGKTKTLTYKRPVNPLVVNEEVLPILQENEVIFEPIQPTDSAWIRLNKQAAINIGITENSWGKQQDELTAELTRLILEEGHDAVDVTSGGDSWVVLLKPELMTASGFSPRYSRTTATTNSPATEAEAQAVLRSLAGTKEAAALINTGRVVIHSNTINLTEQERNDKIGAFIDEKGNIHLVLPFLSSELLNDLLDHESAHLGVMTGYSEGDLSKIKLVNAVLRLSGMSGLIGRPGFEDMIAQINRMADNGVEAAIRARNTVDNLIATGKLSEADRDHELLAYTTEYAPKNLPIYRRIVSAIRVALYRVGVKINLTDDDLTALARGALRERAKAAMRYGDLYQSPASLAYAARKTKDVLTKAEKNASLIPLLYGTSDKTYPNRRVRDVAQAIQRRTRKGNNDHIRTDNEVDNAEIKRIMLAEARAALAKTGNAANWYETKIAEALNIVALLHPEIANDPLKQGVFLYALAATSQGVSVDRNIRLAEKAYNEYKANGQFSPVGEGTSAKSMVKNLELFNDLVRQHGIKRTIGFLFAKFEHREIQKGVDGIKGKVSQISVNQEVFGSLLMGPKIGSFFQNLAGNLQTLTIDLWFSRMWGRLTGDLINLPSEIDAAKAQFIASFTPAVQAEIGFKGKLPNDLDKLLAIAAPVLSRYVNDVFPQTDEFDTAGKAARQFQAAANPHDAPSGVKHREWMTRLTVEVADELGIDPANLQAILWYPEKELYAKLGVKDGKSAPTDFSAEFAKLALQRGIPDADIRSAITAAGNVESHDGQRAGVRRLAGQYIQPGNYRLNKQLNESDRSVAANKRFSRTRSELDNQTPPTSGVSASRVAEKLITPKAALWRHAGITVKAVQSINEVPAIHRPKNADKSEGFYEPKSQTVYLIASNIASMDRAQAVLRHEIVGHYASLMLRDTVEWNGILRNIHRLEQYGNAKVVAAAALVDQYQPELKGNPARRQEEIFAVLVERNEHNQIGVLRGLVDRILLRLKEWLNRLGMDNNWINNRTFGEMMLWARESESGINEGKFSSKPYNWMGMDSEARTSYAGERAKTANQSLLQQAKTRVDAGEDAEVVRKETGWFKGFDQKWRFEIDDSGIKLKSDFNKKRKNSEKYVAYLSDVFDDANIFNAYPALNNIAIIPVNDFGAQTDGKTRIRINSTQLRVSSDNELKSTILHEVSHIIQHIEGFSHGGNPELFEKELKDSLVDLEDKLKTQQIYLHSRSGKFTAPGLNREEYINELNSIKTDRDKIKEAVDLLKNGMGDIAYQKYISIAGEIEARDTANRLDLTPDQRRETAPYRDTMFKDGIADSDVIVNTRNSALSQLSVAAGERAKTADQSSDISVSGNVVKMSPATFLKLAVPFGYQNGPKEDKKKTKMLGALKTWNSKPMLSVKKNDDGTFQIGLHDGRHRAQAALNRGDSLIEVEIARGRKFARENPDVSDADIASKFLTDSILSENGDFEFNSKKQSSQSTIDDSEVRYSRSAPIDLNNPTSARKTFDAVGQNIMDENAEPMSWDRLWDLPRNIFPKTLGFLTRQQLVEMASRKIVGLGRALLPSAEFFENAAALIDGIKSRIKREMYDGLIEPLQRELGKSRQLTAAFDFIIHGSTLHQVDPTQPMREQKANETDEAYAEKIKWHTLLTEKLNDLEKKSPVLADSIKRIFANYVAVNDMKYAAMKERVGRSGFDMMRTTLERVKGYSSESTPVKAVQDTLALLKAANADDMKVVDKVYRAAWRVHNQIKTEQFRIDSPINPQEHRLIIAAKQGYQNLTKVQRALFRARNELAKSPHAARLYEFKMRDPDQYEKLVQLITSTQRRAINVLVDRVSQKSWVPEEYAAMRRELAKLPEDAQLLFKDMNHTFKVRQSYMMESIDLYEQAARSIRPYAPLSRYGKYEVFAERMVPVMDKKTGKPAMNADGTPAMERKVAFSKFETIHDQKKAAKLLKAEGWTVSTDYQIVRDRIKHAPSGTFVGEMFGFIDDSVANPKERDALKESMYQLYLENLPDLSVRKHLIKRNNVFGYHRDALRAYGTFMNGSANMIARLRFADVLSEQLYQMEQEVTELSNHENDQAKAGAVLNELIQSYDWLMNPSNATWANRMTAVGFIWYLTNPSTALVNLSQIPLLTFPALAAKFNGGSAFKQIHRAMGDYARVINRSRQMGWNPLNPPMALKASKQVIDANGQARMDVKYYSYKTEKEYFKAIKDLEAQGMTVDRSVNTLEAAIMETLGGEYNGDMGRFLEFLEKSGRVERSATTQLAGIGEDSWQNQANLKGTASRVAGSAMKVGSFLFHHSEVSNREITALAAYRLMRNQLKNLPSEQAHQKAQDYAFKAVAFTQGDYSNANRARLMRGNFARVMTLFKTFSQMMTWRMLRDAYQSFGNVDAAEKKEARQRLGWMMMNTVILGGMMGLPIYTMVATMMNAIFGNDPDDPWDFELWMQQQLGELLGDTGRKVVMTGPVGAMTGTALSQRLSLDIVRMWVRKVPGDLEGTALTSAYLQQAVGPAFGLGFRAAQGIKDLTHGVSQDNTDLKFRGTEALLPAPLANMVKAWRFMEDGVQTRRGDKLIDEVSGPQLAAQVLGFQPNRLYEIYAQNDKLFDEKTQLERRAKDLIAGYVYAAENHDEDGRLDYKAKIAKYNQTNPRIRIKPEQIQNMLKQRRIRNQKSTNGMYVPSRGMRQVLDEARYTD